MKNPNKHYYKAILAFIVGFLYSISGVAHCQTLKAIKIPVISDAVPAVGINSQLSALNFQLTPNPATGSVTVVDSRSGTASTSPPSPPPPTSSKSSPATPPTFSNSLWNNIDNVMCRNGEHLRLVKGH